MANTLNVGNGNWATKKDSLLAYNSENNNFKPLPFDFTRASSATVVNKDGLIETVGNDIPRIDYSDDANGALKLEPQRSNSLLQSNQFDTTWATSTGIGISSGYSGVYGSNDAWLLKRVDGSSRYLYQNVSLSNTQTFSIYLKADTTNWAWLFLGGTTSWAYFDLENGAVGATNSLLSSKIEPVSDGWFRCSVTANVTSSSVRVYPAQSNIAVSGDSNLGIYIQNAQLEEGSYATSYIPTQGSTVTRLADACNNGANEQVINSTEGVLYTEISALSLNDFSERQINLSNNGTSYLRIQYGGSSGTIYCFVYINGVKVADIRKVGLDTTNLNKVALRYGGLGYTVYINGSFVETDAFAGDFTSYPLVDLSYTTFKGNTKDLRVYNTALTDSELQQLTTI